MDGFREVISKEPTSAWFKIVAALNRDSALLDGEDREFVSYMLHPQPRLCIDRRAREMDPCTAISGQKGFAGVSSA